MQVKNYIMQMNLREVFTKVCELVGKSLQSFFAKYCNAIDWENFGIMHIYIYIYIYRPMFTKLWKIYSNIVFLNQARAWFLEIDLVCEVCVCVCVCVSVCPPPRLVITSGVMWRDMDPIWLVKQVLQLLYGSYSRYR